MPSKAHRAILSTAVLVLLAGMADAQSAGPSDTVSVSTPQRVQTPPSTAPGRLSDNDSQLLKSTLDAARRADIATARTALAQITDPTARKIATWALVDANSDRLTFFELDQARRDLAGWPRAKRRDLAAEKLLETSGQTPHQIIAWFGGGQPTSAEGAMALAGAYRVTGQAQPAADLIRKFWRDRVFDADPQRTMLARFGDGLTQEDHIRRAEILLFATQGPAARDMLPLLPADQQQLAVARMAMRQNAPNAMGLADALPRNVASSPGLAFERAAYYRRRGQDDLAISILQSAATDPAYPEMAARVWDERYHLTLTALKERDDKGAYAASANSGLTQGSDAAEAEFYAGWIALTRLHNPALAETHFKALDRIGSSPITRGRALYWRGRAVEALSGPDAAATFYEAAARYNTTFYGLLAAEKLGITQLDLGNDPEITSADRSRFESRDTIHAAKILIESGERDLFRTFVVSLAEVMPTGGEEALLVDLARAYGEQETSMKAVRSAAQRGFILPERGYPTRTPPQAVNAPEPALVLGITRQESGFDPLARSGAGARGMMQLMPATAAAIARKSGVGYSAGMLEEPEYNMRLGSTFLGSLVNNFSGSYVMAIAAYNAGPGRPTSWTSFCGDPRGAGTDPIDYIECIPFSETRNYVMRVMEGMAVYRARLNGGTAPLSLTADLKRGVYNAAPSADVVAATSLPIGGSNAPIPNP